MEPVSLNEPIFSDENDTVYIMDQISDHSDSNDWLDELSIKESIKKLNNREKKILSMRFFEGKTQMEVANEIGISQAQVSRLEKGAISSIRQNN